MNKKAIAFEELTKIILALLVLVVVIAVFYILFKPPVGSMKQIENTTSSGLKLVLENLVSIFKG